MDTDTFVERATAASSIASWLLEADRTDDELTARCEAAVAEHGGQIGFYRRNAVHMAERQLKDATHHR